MTLLFFDYLQKNSPDKPMSRTEATEYVNSIDIRKGAEIIRTSMLKPLKEVTRQKLDNHN